MTASKTATPPVPEPLLELARFSPEALIDAIIRLTHTIDSVRSKGSPEYVAELRARRAVARAELLRRLADQVTARRFITGEGARKFGVALAIEAGVSPEKATSWSAQTGIGDDPNEVRVEFTVVHVMSVDRFNVLLVEAQG